MLNILLNIVTFLHVMFILFIVITPFVDSNYILLMHIMVIPFMMLHWLTNDNTCMLTIVEKNIRRELYGKKYNEDECFTCKLIEPVYNFTNKYETMSNIIYSITTILWIISIGKIYCKYRRGNITNWMQLFIV